MISLFDPSQGRGTRRILFFLALTGGLGGLQGIFSVQTAMGSPYLLSLGFSKPLIPFVWLAGPLAGLVGQPYFGLCSDQCRIRWGRRNPFIAGGAAVTVVSLLTLAWAGDVVSALAWVVGVRPDHGALQTITRVTAAMLIWVLNFAIQPLQCGLRALIVEACPSDQMDTANAWASRIVSLGSLLGYATCFVDLSHLMHIEGSHAQFKALAVWATCLLAITVLVCCCAIRERDPNQEGPPRRDLRTLLGKIKYIYGSVFRIPPEVAMVCRVQLCSWIGWFSFMYYITTYIGEIYLQKVHPVDMVARRQANTQGSLALLIYAFTQLFTSIAAPALITKPERDLPLVSGTAASRTTSLFLPRFISRQFATTWSSLCALWILSHAVFATCMFGTLLVGHSVIGTTILVGCVGISAALAQIVPFTLISLVLARHHEQQQQGEKATADYETQPGIVMGIHNMSIAAPQLIAAVGSSAIFWLLRTRDGDGDGDGDASRSTGWVLRAGGVAALAAIFMTLKLREKVENADDDDGYISDASELNMGMAL